MDFLNFVAALKNRLSVDFHKIFLIENKHIYMRCSHLPFDGDIQDPNWLRTLLTQAQENLQVPFDLKRANTQPTKIWEVTNPRQIDNQDVYHISLTDK